MRYSGNPCYAKLQGGPNNKSLAPDLEHTAFMFGTVNSFSFLCTRLCCWSPCIKVEFTSPLLKYLTRYLNILNHFWFVRSCLTTCTHYGRANSDRTIIFLFTQPSPWKGVLTAKIVQAAFVRAVNAPRREQDRLSPATAEIRR